MAVLTQWAPIRWVVLFFFCMFNLTNNLQWITFATIVEPTREMFNCTSFEVNSLAWIYAALYVVIAVPCSSLYDRLGLRNAMIIGAALNAIGALGKLGAVPIANFWLLFVFQFISAAAQCFTLGVPPMVAASWFGTKERTLATSLAALSNILGAAVGFPVPPAIVTGGSGLAAQFYTMFAIEGGLCLFTLLGIVLFVADGPPSAPCVSSRVRGEPVAVIPTLKTLLTNKNFCVLALIMGFSNGVYGGLSTIMAQVNQPFGISNSQTGWIGFIASGGSILGSILIGMLIDRLRKYKIPLLVLNFLITAMIGAVLLSFAYDFHPLPSAYVYYTMMQAIESCVCAVVFEYSVELTFPVPEALSGTVLMVLPCLFNFIIVMSSSFIIGDNPDEKTALVALGICVGVSAAATLVTFVLKERLRRVELEAGGAKPGHESYREDEDSASPHHPSRPYDDVTLFIGGAAVVAPSDSSSPHLIASNSDNTGTRFREESSRGSGVETAHIAAIPQRNYAQNNINKINEHETDSEAVGSSHLYSDAALFAGGGGNILGDDHNAGERTRLLS